MSVILDFFQTVTLKREKETDEFTFNNIVH